MKKICSLYFVFAVFATIHTQAQNVGIGATTFTPNASAGLDVDFSNKGLLIPRVALTASNASTPITSAATSLLVYNTATAGTAPNNVTPGYYYWSGSAWLRFFSGNEGWLTTGNSNTAIATNFLGTIDNIPFAIRTNNIERMRITGGAAGAGQVVINSTSPTTDDAFSSYATATRLQAISGYASAVSGGTGVYGISNDNAGVWGQASNGVGIYGVNNSATLGAVSGYNDNAIGTAGIFAGNGLTGGMYDPAGGGIAGTGGTNGYGVYGWNYNGSNSERYGYLGSRTQGAYGQFNANAYGILGTALSGGTNNVGLWGHAANSSGGINVGLAVNSGETVISNVAATGGANLPRNFGGSMFTKLSTAVATGGRIYWMTGTGGFIFYVNSTASADYSEYFKTADHSLGVGEIVAIDPENASSVRRARPNDVANIVGVVSIGGTRYNDDSKGERHNDPNYINIGLLGQVPVLVSTENGNIKPGDALTASKIYRGRVAKATGACRIVGYAITSFPYVDGEQNYEIDILGTDKLRLKADHVMCYLNPTWYEPADITLTDGIEPATVESAFDMQKRVNVEIEAANPNKAQFEKSKEELSKIHSDIQRDRTTPKQAKSLNQRK